MFRQILGCVLLTAIAFGRDACADLGNDPGVAGWLDWTLLDGAESCGDAMAFAGKVAARLGRSPRDAARQSRLAIQARIEHRQTAPFWSATLRVLTFEGAVVGLRKIEQNDESCSPIVDTLALVTELIFAAPSPAAPSPTAASPVDTPPRLTATPPPTVDTPAPLPPATVNLSATGGSRRSWSIAVEGGAAAAVGLLPNVGSGGEISVFVGPARSARGYASVSAWQAAKASTNPTQGATIALALAGTGICTRTLEAGIAQVGACVGADVGRITASGFGFATSATQSRWAADIAAGIHAYRRIVGGLYVTLGFRLTVPLARSEIAFQDADNQIQTIFRAAPLAAIGDLRLGYLLE